MSQSENLHDKRIVVLMGGLSAERDISLRTGSAVLRALQERGLNAAGLDVGRDLPARLIELGTEVAFIALHGRFGEDGTVQGLLELLRIPYTGSGVLASSVAMNKLVAKQVLLHHGVATPGFAVYRRGDDLDAFVAGQTAYPLVSKPAREGSTIGVSIVRDPQQLRAGLEEALRFDDLVLVEEFIAGAEVTVGVLGDQPLPVIQVVPKGGFYDFQSKYTPGQTEYLLPAPLPADVTSRLQAAAVTACRALGCRGAARVDFIVRDAELFCLEVNTIPGMTETSLLPKAAGAVGISFGDLVLRILADAGLDK
ncbi:MAG: D-alanine--D-alanine ligase [Deltaproteobacteria bacterium]|nr:MAG: D-alanine--D-alanine ligase [Deltaproteobacteria bacterium]